MISKEAFFCILQENTGKTGKGFNKLPGVGEAKLHVCPLQFICTHVHVHVC